MKYCEVNIDFTQMHCGRDAVLEQMAEYIDVAADHCFCNIVIPNVFIVDRSTFITSNKNSEISNHEFFVCDEDRQKGIDTPEELREVLSQWGYL